MGTLGGKGLNALRLKNCSTYIMSIYLCIQFDDKRLTDTAERLITTNNLNYATHSLRKMQQIIVSTRK